MKAEILPDWDNDFVNEKDIAAFREALDAPSIDTITSVNDWGPVRQKVRKKRRKPKRGKDETREGFGYIILRWPVLVGVLTWLLVLSICYASVRVYITLQEWLIVWRGKKKTLRQRLRKARTLEEWHHAAKELDTIFSEIPSGCKGGKILHIMTLRQFNEQPRTCGKLENLETSTHCGATSRLASRPTLLEHATRSCTRKHSLAQSDW